MFGKKRKIEKADELRKRANTLRKKQEKLIDKWICENEGKTAKEQKVIDCKYGKLLDEADELANAAYNQYYKFVNKNFKQKDIDEALTATKNFMGKTFINLLKK